MRRTVVCGLAVLVALCAVSFAGEEETGGKVKREKAPVVQESLTGTVMVTKNDDGQASGITLRGEAGDFVIKLNKKSEALVAREGEVVQVKAVATEADGVKSYRLVRITDPAGTTKHGHGKTPKHAEAHEEAPMDLEAVQPEADEPEM